MSLLARIGLFAAGSDLDPDLRAGQAALVGAATVAAE
jgi:hypothetical protein